MFNLKSLLVVLVAISLVGCGSSKKPSVEAVNTGDSKSDVLAMMAQANVPGVSVAVIKDFEIVETIAAGVIDQNSQVSVTEQTRFQAASISKIVTALAVTKWAAETQISMDTDIKDMLTSWELPDNGLLNQEAVTIEGLLRHTAGINVHGFAGYNRSGPIPTLLQVLEGSGVANSDPIQVTSAPNSEWRYSGGGFTVLQQAIEDYNNMSFSEFMDWQLIDFLGLKNSTFDLEADFDVSTVSTGHFQGDTPITNQFHVYPEKAAAGYWTTATDLAKLGIQFQRALTGGSQWLTAEQAHRMLEPTLSAGYGIGIQLDEEGMFGHMGANEGFLSVMALNQDGFGVVLLTNSDFGVDLFEPIINYFEEKYN